MSELSILICTYRREAWLGELLDALAGQLGAPDAINVLVVDNDPHGGAKATVASHTGVGYVHEPRRGVSHARNTAIASSRAPLLLMLDDDQLVEPDFVPRLMAAWDSRPDGTAGLRVQVSPLVGTMPSPTPPTSAAFSPVDRAAFGTGGLLMLRAALNNLDGPFDPALGLSGGEDTDLFVRATARGAVFMCPDGLVVHERVQPHRQRLGYQLQREFRAGRLDHVIDVQRGQVGLPWLARARRWLSPEPWETLATRAMNLATSPAPCATLGRVLAYRIGAVYQRALDLRRRAAAPADAAGERWS